MAERRNHLVLLGLIVAVLVGAVLLAVPGSPVHRKPVLGLDLQGGLEVVLKAVPPKGHQLTSEDIDRSISIMRNRIDKLGVTEPEIRKQGADEIAIELAGVKDPKVAANLIGKTAVLEMYDFEADVIGPSRDLNGNPVPLPSLYNVLTATQTESLVKKNGAGQWFLFDAKKRAVVGPMPTKKAVLASDLVKRKLKGELPKKYRIVAAPKKSVVVSCPIQNGCLGTPPGSAQSATYFYLLKRIDNPVNPIPELTGQQLKLSAIRADFDQQNQPIVTLDFNGKGRKIFHKITQSEARRGALKATTAGAGTGQVDQRYVQHFAIVLDGEVKSLPYIDYVQNPDGISGGTGAQINIGSGGIGAAKDLALVLQTGSLPIAFQTAEQTDVSATLGKDSLRQALRAAIVGLAVVALFLLVLYRFLGLVAVFGLGIYAALMYAAILLFKVTLTLPGFAGLILTIGVAADANVVVFERIKEEVRAGKSVRAAIGAGYAKGFHTILDANMVTAITALVLFAVATAGVKGFALMLLIGTIVSLVTAVAATRAMLGLLANFRWFDNPRFMGAQGQQTAKWLQIDFMRRKNLWFAISGVIVAIGIVSLGTKHLNLGIDFKGGTQITFKTSKPHTVGDVRSVADLNGRRDAVIQARGTQVSADHYKSFQIRTKALSGNQLAKFGTDLQNRVDAVSVGKNTVSSSFGRQIAKSALLAIFVSLLLIVIYIGIRFDLKFAGPVIAALIHDIVITVGVYSVTGREVTSATVAAVLTVLGYSIYDTIIIFDRMRENIPLMRRAPFATIANVSLWETIRRSLATTFITLLPVLALFLFGGATLKDFAFALLVGITSGAYSSIFIAAPLLTLWKEREPEYARRRGQVEAPETDGGVPVTTGRRVLRPRGAAADAGTIALEEATHAAAAEPAPALDGELRPQPSSSAQAKRDARRQRRRTRPHGRAR